MSGALPLLPLRDFVTPTKTVLHFFNLLHAVGLGYVVVKALLY